MLTKEQIEQMRQQISASILEYPKGKELLEQSGVTPLQVEMMSFLIATGIRLYDAALRG